MQGPEGPQGPAGQKVSWPSWVWWGGAGGCEMVCVVALMGGHRGISVCSRVTLENQDCQALKGQE